ncbi:MAG: alpha/beta hydrolase [Rubripirellula sp.]
MHAPPTSLVRRMLSQFAAVTWIAFICQHPVSADEPSSLDMPKPSQVVKIWPDHPPQWNAPAAAEADTTEPSGGKVADRRVIRLGNVSTPELHVYSPENGASVDTAVLIAPGGGYSILAWDLEGSEIATWLQELGITAVVVKYRVPTRTEPEKWLAPVQDLQRSIGILRNGGIEGVSATRIGVLGFSAGGNASARVATASRRLYEPVDQYDQGSVKPDFAVLVYPAWLVKDDDRTELIEDIAVTDETPPMFFAHAADDRVTCMSSVTLFGHLRSHNIPASLHVFASGGHGFGARQAGQPTDAWPSLCEKWLDSQGWLTK